MENEKERDIDITQPLLTVDYAWQKA